MRQVILVHIQPLDGGFRAECRDFPVAVEADSLEGVIALAHRELEPYFVSGEEPQTDSGEAPWVFIDLNFSPLASAH